MSKRSQYPSGAVSCLLFTGPLAWMRGSGVPSLKFQTVPTENETTKPHHSCAV